MKPNVFPPLAGTPILQFTRPEPKYQFDFDILGGIWILSEPVHRFFESTDKDAFQFRECKTIFPYGSPGPYRCAALVVSMIDALDVEKSEVTRKRYDPRDKTLDYGILPRLVQFRKAVVAGHDFFLVPQNNADILVSQRVKDEFRRNRWHGATFMSEDLI